MSSSSRLLSHAARQLDRAIVRSMKQNSRAESKLRNQQRKAAIKHYKIEEKQRAIASAADAVRKYEEYLHTLVSIHHHSTTPIDWNEVLAEPEPLIPVRSTANEDEAVCRRAAYVPSFFARTFRFKNIQLRNLDRKVELARQSDEAAYLTQKARHDEELTEWKCDLEMAKGVLAQDVKIYKQVLDYFETFTELAEYGSRMQFHLLPDNACVDLFIDSKDLLPMEVLSQTSTGKLSRKAMPASRSNALYQEFVCSAVLRVAREMFACLPIQLVVVNAVSTQIDPSTGKSGEQAILSVAFTRNGLQELNFEHLEPPAALRNFVCNMKFGKTTGFAPVDVIDPATLILQ